MSKFVDLKDDSGERLYPTTLSTVTYMRDGVTVEVTINDIKEDQAGVAEDLADLQTEVKNIGYMQDETPVNTKLATVDGDLTTLSNNFTNFKTSCERTDVIVTSSNFPISAGSIDISSAFRKTLYAGRMYKVEITSNVLGPRAIFSFGGATESIQIIGEIPAGEISGSFNVTPAQDHKEFTVRLNEAAPETITFQVTISVVNVNRFDWLQYQIDKLLENS